MDYEDRMSEYERLQDYNLVAAFVNNETPFPIEDVDKVLASHEGDRDVDAWTWLVQLVTGEFVFTAGGCDYTGWD